MMKSILHRSGKGVLALICVLFAGIAGVIFWFTPNSPPTQESNSLGFISVSNEGGYVGSSNCKQCHAEQYASWHRSFHRTMTQIATPDTVLAPFDNEELEFEGQLYRLEQERDRFYVSVSSPPTPGRGGLMFERREIVMTTGSHHIQVYWILEPSAQFLIELPFYFHLAERRWLLRNDTLLQPPGKIQYPSRWNDRCIKCHSVNGVPGLNEEHRKFNTQVAELGIACEACHGPGQSHVGYHENPSNRKNVGAADSTIVNPRYLDSKAATQICGRCHSATEPHGFLQYLKTGLAFRPGDDLHDFVTLNQFDPLAEQLQDEVGDFIGTYSVDGYWKDGTCRVGGDEYNALIESPCYLQGSLSCLSCHSMHESEPDDQLARHASDNRACTQCHKEPRFNANLSAHTHHPAESSGSQCYNCHMPYISYALLKAIRSHRVDIPSVVDTVRSDKPNACNLCHLDQTLEWTSRHLTDWHGHEEPKLSDEEKTIAASVLWLQKGNAAQRVIAAWHMGWAPALEASGEDWQASQLSASLDDPYSAIRFVAFRSLKSLPGFESFRYDFIGPLDGRRESVQNALKIWKSAQPLNQNRRDRTAVLLDGNGELLANELERLRHQRDNTPVSIAE